MAWAPCKGHDLSSHVVACPCNGFVPLSMYILYIHTYVVCRSICRDMYVVLCLFYVPCALTSNYWRC